MDNMNRSCKRCGVQFVAHDWRQVYCCRRCNDLSQAERHQQRRIAMQEANTIEQTCPVCGKRFRDKDFRWVTCSEECSFTRRAQQRNARRKKTVFDAAANKQIRGFTSIAYTDDMAGKTIVRTSSPRNFVGLPVVILKYESMNIGGKTTTIQHSVNGWIDSITGDTAVIVGPRIAIEVNISQIERI